MSARSLAGSDLTLRNLAVSGLSVNEFDVNSITADIAIVNDTLIAEDAVVNDTLTVNGSTTMNQELIVNSSCSAASLSVTNATSLQTLAVSGDANFNSAVNITGDLVVSGSVTTGSSSYGMEVANDYLYGNDATNSGTITLNYNTTATTNYAVMCTPYYGYTDTTNAQFYSAQQTSGALRSIIISNRGSTSFDWYLDKESAYAVNIYLVFLIIYNAPGASAVPVSYSTTNNSS